MTGVVNPGHIGGIIDWGDNLRPGWQFSANFSNGEATRAYLTRALGQGITKSTLA